MAAVEGADIPTSEAAAENVVAVQDDVAPPPGSTDEEDVFFVSLSFSGDLYEVPVQFDDAVCSIFDFVHEVLDLPQENCKLIFRGRVLRLNDASQTIRHAGLKTGSKLMLMASTAHDIAFVQTSRADPLVKGFAEEERDELSRRKRAKAAEGSLWGTKQDTEYRFGSIKAEFKYSTPPPYDAEKLLQRLATDPGIIEIMTTRRFKVGVLTEMSPSEAQERMAKRGTPNMDLLGYNMNSGDMIVLRLRTDNVKGFRPYHDLINTLLHELTHNVWGPHDHNFWKLFGELKAQYMRFHRFWSHGGKAADSGASGGQFTGFVSGVNEDGEGGDQSFGKLLGGAVEEGEGAVSDAVRRERALLAAEARKVGEPPKPNFLTGDGKWVIVCPCGQVHDSGDCPFGGQAPAEGLEASVSGTEEASTSVPVTDGRVARVSGNTPSVERVATISSAMSPSGQDAAVVSTAQLATPAATETAGPGACETIRAASNRSATTSTDAADSVAAAAATPSIGNDVTIVESGIRELDTAASVEDPNASLPPAPALDPADLEALGLGGATEWLQRFSSQLQALRQGSSSSTRVAVEMMLRLVRNVVNHPHDPKYRRIRSDNPRIRAELFDVVGESADPLMALLGFDTTVEAGAKVFVLRDALFDSVRLRMGQELLELELKTCAVATP
eukprot:TRINITY_DN734_c0_g2_i1.p1 TRINITY_DN734_c0_g2~~TRINITY_DN734_c0_g2_i1.p1  ORF type:complete len:697 (+),score=127.05 TRINITY_DN734_c0_g2_i1:82-2091(+)